MKFAKELEDNLVPEWKVKYLDYKACKKKVKAITRALRNVNGSPKTPGRRIPANLFSNASFQIPVQTRSSSDLSLAHGSQEPESMERSPFAHVSGSSKKGKMVPRGSKPEKSSLNAVSTPTTIPERQSSRGSDEYLHSLWGSGGVTNYGSIVASPSPPGPTLPLGPPKLELPDPALSPDKEVSFPRNHSAWRHSRAPLQATPSVQRITSGAGDAYHVGITHTPSKLGAKFLPKHRNLLRLQRTVSTPNIGAKPSRPTFLKRILSVAGTPSPPIRDVPLEAYKEFDHSQADFFMFLDIELEKIETFYRSKETEAASRLQILREQLHEMRDRRVEEVLAVRRTQDVARQDHEQTEGNYAEYTDDDVGDRDNSHPMGHKWLRPIEKAVGINAHRFGKNTKAFENMHPFPGLEPRDSAKPNTWESQRDFTRRPAAHDDVPYRSAKRKLKIALQEFYRGLELLKSYALLNRTAFRKINKKYDKAVNARPTGRYTSEKVNKAWFVQSEVLDGHIQAVEDLYARYFERGNHKVAVGKLRSKHSKIGDYSGSVFRNGLSIAAGTVLGIQGIVYGNDHLSSPDPMIAVNTSYLLQIYAGYFLALLLFLLFCLDARTWSRAKINYVFIFEFDTRHNLDWRQLAELPCFLLFLEGLLLWLNFQQPGSSAMYIYWPVVLVGLTLLILAFPGPFLYYRSREWWAYSNGRLLLAGLYPVEFRDFFLGDMYCSQTYAMGNLELFFCVYARHWNNPVQCNSSHSRVLGFFSTLPGIWRALQCLRRYYDTRNAFPHLVNCGKYLFTILYYMTLSLYRIDRNIYLKALFIACATVNGVYTSVWDLAMDWSLGNPYAKNRFLRDVLGYKRPWVYYLAMIFDPILRFNWVFYAIYSDDLQHSALLSFIIGLTEVFRRAIWTLFRVENEHCTNVGRFRASRDVPLPYEIPTPPVATESIMEEEPSEDFTPPPQSVVEPGHHIQSSSVAPSHASSGSDLEQAIAIPSSGTLRRRRPQSEVPTPLQRGLTRVGTIMATAHAQDFERKRTPAAIARDAGSKNDKADEADVGSSDDEEDGADELENQQDIFDAEGILRRHRSATGPPIR